MPLVTLHLSSGSQLSYPLTDPATDDVLGAMRAYWRDPHSVRGDLLLQLTAGTEHADVPMQHVIAVETEPEDPTDDPT